MIKLVQLAVIVQLIFLINLYGSQIIDDKVEALTKSGSIALLETLNKGHQIINYLDRAVEHGNEVLVDMLASSCRYECYLDQLIVAANNGFVEVVRVLLSHNCQQTDKVLEIAARNGDTEMLTLILLDYIKNKNRMSYDFITPLISGCQEGHVEIVRMLMYYVKEAINEELVEQYRTLAQYVADSDEDYNAPLSVTTDPEVISLLQNITNDCDDVSFAPLSLFGSLRELLMRNPRQVFHGKRPLYDAARAGDIQLFRLLLYYLLTAADNPYFTDALDSSTQPTPLYGAAENGHVQIVRLLLATVDARVAGRDRHCEGKTPLYIAAENGHTAVVRVLLENGADFRKSYSWDGRQLTPLGIAAWKCHAGCVKLLIDYELSIDPDKRDDKFLENPLFEALERGQGSDKVKAIVALFLEARVNANLQDSRSRNPLHISAERGFASVAELLLNYGAEINLHCNGMLPLTKAAEMGHKDVVALLIKRDSRVLHAAAAATNDKETLELLLKNRPGIQRYESSNVDAFYNAMRDMGDDISSVSCLFYPGLDLNARDENDATMLHRAACLGYINKVNFLLQNGADKDLKNGDEDTALCLAVKNGHLGVVTALLNHLAKIDEPLCLVKSNIRKLQDAARAGKNVSAELQHWQAILALFNGSSVNYIKALFAAVRRNDLRAVKSLLDPTIINAQDPTTGASVLHIAAESGYDEIIELLLEYDANMKLRDRKGKTALYLAASSDHTEIVKLLLEKQEELLSGNTYSADKPYLADDAQKDIDNCGSTLLHLAASNGNKKLVRLFIDECVNQEEGVDIDIATHADENETPLYCAAKNGHKEIVKLLVKNGAVIDKALYKAVANGEIVIVQCLIDCGADVNAKCEDDETLLSLAVSAGFVPIVKVLLLNNASVDDVGADGSPLYIAASNGHTVIVELLLSKGADANKPAAHGFTPLYIASQKDHFEIVKLLIEAGADKEKASNSGITPLYIASRKGHFKVVKFLVLKGADKAKKCNGVSPLEIAYKCGHGDVIEYLSK